MKGWLVHFIWDWAGAYYGLTVLYKERRSAFWIPTGKYASSQLASTVAWLTSGNTWVSMDDGDFPDVDKQRIQVYRYYIQDVEL
jgi:hypothetical protein